MTPRLVPNVVRGDLTDGEIVVNVPGKERALILNAMGDVILELCDGSRTVEDIAGVIRASMQVPADVDVTRDVTKLIDELLTAGVIEST